MKWNIQIFWINLSILLKNNNNSQPTNQPNKKTNKSSENLFYHK